ncbi:hypothetical protein [Nonomuraea sp. NPDC023979]|uniref:hypothetical protein n=1 Tax=Nonomuraea sp. NPDC023979 TaxID=3154796 RepID=UPI0033D9E74A
MTSIAELPADFTLGDLADMRRAVWDVQLRDYTTLTAHDRTALVRLATWPGLGQDHIDLIALITSGQQPLPLDDAAAELLQLLLSLLPSPSVAELVEWKKTQARDDSPVGRALAVIAAHVAEQIDAGATADALRFALVSAVRAAWPHLPLHEAPRLAARLIVRARRDLQASDSATVQAVSA